MKCMRKNYVEGSVTIEYTLLMPVLLLLYTFLVCMGLFMYNQCILQTNVYILGAEGARLLHEDASAKVTKLKRIEEQLYYDKYLLATDMQTTYFVRGNQIQISGCGQMINPFAPYGIGEEYWELNAACEITVLNPGDTLRLCKSIRNILQDVLTEEVKDDS